MANKLHLQIKNPLSFSDLRIVKCISEYFKSDAGQVQFGAGNLTGYIGSRPWLPPEALLEYEIAEKSTCEEEISPYTSAWIFLPSEIIPVCWALEPSIKNRWGMFGNSILLTEHHSIYLSWHAQRSKMLIEVLLGHNHQCFAGDRIFMPDRDTSVLAVAA